MQNFGLGDLGAIALILFCMALWYLEVPQRLWVRAAPKVEAFLRGDILQVHVLSSSEPGRQAERPGSTAGSGGSGDLVLGHTHQVEPENGAQNEPASLRNLSRLEEIVWLATLRNDDGSYRHSANQITAFVGGTAADVKATIASVRGTKKEPPKGHIERPVNGWGSS